MEKMGLSGEDSSKQRMKDTAVCDDDDAEEMIKSRMFWPHEKK